MFSNRAELDIGLQRESAIIEGYGDARKRRPDHSDLSYLQC
jgi:hypothetical protein